MIDENLPVFYYKAPKDHVKQDATIFLQQYDESSPVYTLKYPDPNSPDARNRYAAALYDCYNSDVLYGEVLVVPDWTQGSQSAEEQRRAPLAPARPEPTLPSKCTIQLYNPDQQIVLQHQPSKWNTNEAWQFDLPQETFRQPSASALDQGRSDPAALEETPVISLKWKRVGKVSKDITCYLEGSTRNPDGSKKKHKEPDITLAYFKGLREITIYEPNLSRVDIEDPKGFEVTLLLGATLIRDIYHGSLKEAFNISDGPYRRSSAEGRTAHQPPLPAVLSKPTSHSGPPVAAAAIVGSPPPHGPGPYSMQPPNATTSGGPPMDPRTQWEHDAETARLKKAAEREAKAAEHQKKKEEKKNAKVAQKLAVEEERAARARQAALDAETARLRQKFGQQGGHAQPPPPPPHPQPLPYQPQQHQYFNQAPPPLPPRQPSPAVRPPPSPKPDKKKDKHKHKHAHVNTVPSVPSANFLSPPPQHGGFFGPPRPASASGFAGFAPGMPAPMPGWHGPVPSHGGPPPPQMWAAPNAHLRPHSVGPPRPRSASDIGRKKESFLDRIL